MPRRPYDQEVHGSSLSKGPDQKLEEVDGKVDDLQVRVAVLDTRVKIGFAVLGALLASPKLGGPTAEQVAVSVPRLLGL